MPTAGFPGAPTSITLNSRTEGADLASAPAGAATAARTISARAIRVDLFMARLSHFWIEPLYRRQPRRLPKQRGCANDSINGPPKKTPGAPGLRLGHLLWLQNHGQPPPPESRHRPLLGHQPDRGPLPLRRNPSRHRPPLPPPPHRRRALRPRGQIARRAALSAQPTAMTETPVLITI